MNRAVAVILLVAGAIVVAEAQPRGWRRLDTDHFTFVYQPGDAAAVAELISLSDSVYTSAAGYLQSQPPERIPVVVRGRTAYANGFYTTFPNHIELFVAAPSGPWLSAQRRSWLELVFVHELIHYIHLSRPVGFFALPARLFGPTTMSANLAWMPGWFIEGVTVTGETLLTDGGRGRNAFFEMTYSAPILEGRMFSYDQAAFGSAFAPSGRIYVGGYAFVDYLEERYGTEIVPLLHRRYSRWPFLGMRRAIRRETGVRAVDLYDEMVLNLEARFAGRSSYRTGDLLHPRAPGDYYLPRRTSSGWIGYRETTRERAALAEASVGPIDRSGRVGTGRGGTSPAGAGRADTTTSIAYRAPPWFPVVPLRPSDPWSFSVDAKGSTAVASVTTADWVRGDSQTSYSDLYAVDLGSGEATAITNHERFYHPEISPDGKTIVAVERQGSYSRLVSMGLDGSDRAVVFETDKTQLFTPRFSPDGRQLVAVINDHGAQELLLFVRDSNGQFLPGKRLSGLLPPPAAVYFPRFSSNNTLLFGSDLGGELALYEVDLSALSVFRVLRDIFGAYEGERVKGGIVYASYSADGYAVRFKPTEQLLSERVSTGASLSVAPEKGVAKTETGADDSAQSPQNLSRRYVDWPRPGFWLPLASLSGTTDSTDVSFGAIAMLASNLGNNRVTASGLWNTADESATGDLSYSHRFRSANLDFSVAETDSTRSATAQVQKPLWYRWGPVAERSLTGGAAAGYTGSKETNDTVFAGATAALQREVGAPSRAFYGGTASLVQATAISAMETGTRDGCTGDRFRFAASHIQATGIAAQVIEASATAEIVTGNLLDTNVNHRARVDWDAPNGVQRTAFGTIAYDVPIGLFDRGFGTSAALGAGFSVYGEQLFVESGSTLSPESTAAGAEIATDLLLWNVPVRLLSGIAYHFQRDELAWYVRIEPPAGYSISRTRPEIQMP